MSGPFVAVLGARSLPASASRAVGAVVRSAVLAGGVVVTSCCRSGAPALARAACGALGAAPVVWSAASFGSGPCSLAARSSALVRSLVAGGRAVVFLAGPCPAGVFPARSWRSGSPPSGAWSEAALAVGLGVPLVVVWAAPGAPSLPLWPGGAWSPVALPGVALPAFAWSPGQPALF